MKKFKFRLERVLNYRKVIKDEKTRTLMLKNFELRERIGRLRELEAAALLNILKEKVRMAASEVYLAGMYGERLREEIANQEVAVQASEEEARQAMVEYIEAAKDAESLETLKRRRKTEYLDHVNKEEGKFLDEIATQKGNTLNN